MLPIKTEKSNFVYLGPVPGVMDLDCQVVRDKAGEQVIVASVWKPSDEEREAIASGANVRLCIYTTEAIPPVALDATEEKEV